MFEETSLHCHAPADELADPSPTAPQFLRGSWYTLPSGRLVQVCRPGKEASANSINLRYVNGDGVMETGGVEVCPWWLHRYGKSLGHAGQGKS